MKLKLYDTTLRDGAQTEGVSFSIEDKIKIVKLLDSMGIHYIEAGWPGSNPKDSQFFKKVLEVPLKNSKIVAFSMTRRVGVKVEDDKNIQELVECGAPAVALVGKTWDYHVTHAVKTTLEENLAMIRDTVAYLKKNGKEVIYDAEHFFDAFKANPDYALATVKEAEKAGADCICLCETNGSCLPHEIERIVTELKPHISIPFGIHTHNDADCAVANALVAVKLGASQVQGTFNGLGERCGNANLCSMIPALKVKMGIDCISDENLARLTDVARHISEIANLPLSTHAPYVGRSAFAHKGGMHASAVMKDPKTYEHMDPAIVGNSRRVTISELSGISNLLFKAKEFGVDLQKDSPAIKGLLNKLKQLEHDGYQFEEGEASFEILVKKTMGLFKLPFEWSKFEVKAVKGKGVKTNVEAKVEIKIGKKVYHAKGSGNGPVNALDEAARGVLLKHFPAIKDLKLTDYKVRVLNSKDGTGAKVRVLIESADDNRSWGTVGVSPNIIEASWTALVDSIEYKLMQEGI